MAVTWITKQKDTDVYWVSEGGSGRLKLTAEQADTWIKNFNQAAKSGAILQTDRPVNLNGSTRVTALADVTESAKGSLVLLGVDLSEYQ
jgi:hypothetical protein